MPALGLFAVRSILTLPALYFNRVGFFGFDQLEVLNGDWKVGWGEKPGYFSPSQFPSCGLSSGKWLHFLRESVLLKSPTLIPASFWWSQPTGSNIITPHFALQPEDVVVSCSFQSLGYLSIPFLVLSSSVTCANSSLQ